MDFRMNYAYWFANIPGLTNRARLRISAAVGAEELFFLSEGSIAKLSGVTPEQAERIVRSRTRPVDAAYHAMCAEGISFVSVEDESYPGKLRQIPDAPYGIYVRGPLPESDRPAVAVVGARMCSEYGRQAAAQLGRKLAERGVCVVSGMARGIDAAGHQGAVDAAGVTCAVLGCGADVCYPKSNRELYRRILERGCVLSEYPPGTPPIAAHFPARNRIIAGLCDMTVVVEARLRSGSLITADCALEQGRDVYAVPGSIYDPLSAGCNDLIRQGAGMISDMDDFVNSIVSERDDICNNEEPEKILLEKEERLVYSCVDLRPKSMEEILSESGIELRELQQILSVLQQRGVIAEIFKNCYIRRN